jgi:hypothetical protein
MSKKHLTPKDRRKARAKASAKDKLLTENKEHKSMKHVEKIKKADRPAPICSIEETSNTFEIRVRCMTCPCCATSWCYQHIRETETDLYCQNCSFEKKIKGQNNKIR